MTTRSLSFEESLSESAAVLRSRQAGGLDDQSFAASMAALLSSEAAARGFFVTLLTGDFRLSDEPDATLIAALDGERETVPSLLARNLVMSTTMAMTHERNGDAEAAAGSRRVAERTARIVAALDATRMQAVLVHMLAALEGQGGLFRAFLERRQYDADQLAAAREAVEALIESLA